MINFKRLDHVLITVPEGMLEEAAHFYSEVLALPEIPGEHPGGALWFSIAGVEIHLRMEAGENYSDRHSAFEVHDLDEAKAFLESKNVPITHSSEIEGRKRLFFRDPFENRFELIEFLHS